MKETTRLPNPTINDCTSNTYQYTLLQPHTYTYDYEDFNGNITSCTAAYPDEWNTSGFPCTKVAQTTNPRFTCLTAHRNWIGDSSLA